MPKQLHCHHVDCFNSIQSGFMHILETTIRVQSPATPYCKITYRRKGQPVTINIPQQYNLNFSRPRNYRSIIYEFWNNKIERQTKK
jgi:hypothetical protein